MSLELDMLEAYVEEAKRTYIVGGSQEQAHGMLLHDVLCLLKAVGPLSDYKKRVTDILSSISNDDIEYVVRRTLMLKRPAA